MRHCSISQTSPSSLVAKLDGWNECKNMTLSSSIFLANRMSSQMQSHGDQTCYSTPSLLLKSTTRLNPLSRVHFPLILTSNQSSTLSLATLLIDLSPCP